MVEATEQRKLTPEQSEFVATNAPLARSFAVENWKKYRVKFGQLSFSDMLSSSYLGLCNAARCWESERESGAKFAPYAWRAMWRQCEKDSRRASRRFLVLCLYHPEYDGDLLSRVAVSNDDPIDEGMTPAIARALGSLSTVDIKSLENVMHGRSLVDLSKEIGVTKTRIGQRRNRALKRLRAMLSGWYREQQEA